MEEVDNIIIETLRNLNCDIDDEITELKDFSPELLTSCIVACLECITPEIKLPHKLPPSMSVRLKTATTLADHIKKLGYRGDMGYQTILYFNEVDIRRVFMFLVERLPKETNKTVINEEIGYMQRLVKQVEKNLQIALEKPWVPTSIVKLGTREYNETQMKQTCGLSIPLNTVHLEVPESDEKTLDALKHYWIHNVPVVTKQCDHRFLIPSLLFQDNEYTYDQDTNISNDSSDSDLKLDAYTIPNNLNQIYITQENLTGQANVIAEAISSPKSSKMELLPAEIERCKSQLNECIQEYKIREMKLNELKGRKKTEEKVLQDILSKIKVKSKALNVLSKEENMEKLKTLVETGSDRLIDLANQWNEVQSPLLEQYRSLQNSLSSQELKLQEEQDKFNKVKLKLNNITDELKEKEILEQQLVEEHSRINKNSNRSVYTRKILEIIGNIKKQDEEIKKILKDTKEVQKDINNLNGQLDRSFALSDELIFRDAKQDEMARKAYKLLAALHNDCSEIVQAITNLGLLERESRNLQEQVEIEIAKEYGAKLERVNRDLQEIKKEMAIMKTLE